MVLVFGPQPGLSAGDSKKTPHAANRPWAV